MTDTTVSMDPARDDAFAAYLLALEDGQDETAHRILRDHPGLADEAAVFHALAARVSKPWTAEPGTLPIDDTVRWLGEYELLQVVGRGGEGLVYKARHKTLRNHVAVKIMRTDRLASACEIERFDRANALLARLQHPHIVRIYHADRSERGRYFAMELLDGGSLKQKLNNGWLPTPRQAAQLVRCLAEAIQYAHDQEIIHRDLKPANVLCQDNSASASSLPELAGLSFTPKIADFGLAKDLVEGDLSLAESVAQSGVLVGTAPYMSPEHTRGEADKAGDVYGLGAILYELLTGRAPLRGVTLQDTLEKVRTEAPVPVRALSPKVPRDLETICLACLEKNPNLRYASAAKLAADLQHFLNDEPIEWRPPGLGEQFVRMVTRQILTGSPLAWGWALIISGILCGVTYLTQTWCIATEQPDSLLYGISWIHAALIAAIFWVALRTRPWGTGDREGVTYVAVHLIAYILVPLVYRPGEGMDPTTYRLSLVPLLAFVGGIIILTEGALYWGGYYLVGTAYIAFAFFLKLIPTWAPLVFSIYSAAFLIFLGLFFLRTEKLLRLRR
jgi:serine/threonine-protein kinase